MRFHLVLVALFGATSVFCSEVSAFKNQTYQINALNNIQMDIGELKQSIEGLQSVVDGLSKTNQRQNIRLNDLESAFTNDLNTQLLELKKTQIQQNEQIEKLKAAITALGEALDSKSTAKQSTRKVVTNEPSKVASSSANSNANLANSTQKPTYQSLKSLMEQADRDFKAKKYDDARAAFESLIENDYKPAYSNYMLGEIAYANKQYKEAIPYYKASVNLYDQGSYMPRLLYHTAISCDKIGEKENANKFYAALKQAYPESAEAKASPTRK